MRLPEFLRGLFWDQDFDRLSWPGHREAIIARVLAEGGLNAIAWLRARVDVGEWIRAHRGRGLSDRQLRYWQILLDLPAREVDGWLADPARRVWEERARR